MALYGNKETDTLMVSMTKISSLIAVCLAFSCNSGDGKTKPVISGEQRQEVSPRTASVYASIGDIAVPEGYKRVEASVGSFAEWTRKLRLKKDKTVYLYDGSKKRNQSAQFAVVDISTGKQDLQQCADVVMRLRAEYLYNHQLYDSIAFMDYSGKWYNWKGKGNRRAFDSYLLNVFGWCGSASLEKQLKPVSNVLKMQPGDVLIRGGFPGHAVMVVDMAVNKMGKKVYMLVQGYQPAQDMHVLVNPNDLQLSPWYELTEEQEINTPEWQFKKDQLRRW